MSWLAGDEVADDEAAFLRLVPLPLVAPGAGEAVAAAVAGEFSTVIVPVAAGGWPALLPVAAAGCAFLARFADP